MTAPRTDPPVPAYMTVSAHIRQLGLSRGRFYTLLAAGFFLPPVYLLANRRPVYTAEIAERNVVAKAVGIGAVTGEPRVFYRSRRQTAESATAAQPRRSRRAAGRERRTESPTRSIVAAVRNLGIEGVDDDAVAQIMNDLFPAGTDGMAEGDIIRAVYRRLRQREPA